MEPLNFLIRFRCLAVMMVLSFSAVAATGQKLNFAFTDVPMETVLRKISEQTTYRFVYSDALSAVKANVSIKAEDEDPLEFFKRFFPRFDIIYRVDKTQVLLSNRQIAQAGKDNEPEDESVQPASRQGSLSGRITAPDGEPLFGAIVRNVARNTGGVADLEGRFSVPASYGDSIVVSAIGYKAYGFTMGRRTEMTIVLRDDIETIDEVVVVGYGTAKRSTMVGSVNTISAKDIAKRPVTSVGAVLFAAAPGVMATSGTGTPGDDPSIRIRGFGTINASSAPLMVVDGAPFDLSLRTINPQDIDNISILKDAAATAIFGSRGANGVIMITTKKGSRTKSSFSVSIQQGINMRFIPEQETVSPQDYYQLMYEAKRNGLYYSSEGLNLDMDVATRLAATGGTYRGNRYVGIFEDLGRYNPFYGIDNNEIIDPVTGKLNPAATQLKWGDDLDWFEPMSRVGKRTDLSMSASGGNEKSDYYASLNYLDDNAWMKHSFTKRLSARTNVNFQPVKWFRAGTNLAGSLVNSYNRSWSGDSSDNPFFAARVIGSIYPVYLHDQTTGVYILDENGDKIFDTGNQVIDGVQYPNRPALGSNRNTVAEMLADDMQYKRLSLQSRTFAEFIFLDGFKFTLNANISYSHYSGYNYNSNRIGVYAPAGRSSRTERNNSSENYQQLLSYNKTFCNKHEIDVVVGHESFQTLQRQVYILKSGQIIDDGNIEFPNFADLIDNSSSWGEYRSEGYLSRANYSYDKGRYSIEGSYRYDGISKFSPEVRWGGFWSIGAGWNIAREAFMERCDWVNTLKFRASYGTNGNAEGVPNYWQDTYLLNHNNQSEPGYYMDPEAGNDKLTWEKQRQFSVALDYSLFSGRIRGAVEYFNKISDGLHFRVTLPASTGRTSQMQNVGQVYNRGVEIDLSGDVIRSRSLTWNVGVTASTLRNRITHMPFDNPEEIRGTKKLMVGSSIYDFWLRDWWGVDPRDGASLFRFDPAKTWNENTCRVMEDGSLATTDSSKALYVYAGSSIPDLYGVVSTALYYRGFTLNFRLAYQIGGKTFDNIYNRLASSGNYGYALHEDMLRRWQQPGDITDVPRMDNAQAQAYALNSTRFLISSSYLYLNTAALSYTFQGKVLQKLNVGSMVVTLSGESLFLRSARKGLNPMESFDGTNSNQYSPSRVITLGISLTL